MGRLPEHRGNCVFTTVPINVPPHTFTPHKADPIGQLCSVYMCPFFEDEHPVIDTIWLNPKDKVTI